MDTRGRSSVLARTALLGITLLLAILALTFGPLGGSAFAAPSVAQCNGVANTGGLELLCDVTVTNTLDVATGVGRLRRDPAGMPWSGEHRQPRVHHDDDDVRHALDVGGPVQ
ncbi:hypothetical protein KIV56_16265 [Cryobacterium breve]|uniref:Secreted protein n=1 Tax=Cryobacterium breve TaxID=1259258 RepID=A0ABY7NDA8_9MICO|nr:hypothetical protein [Cryobacterium breve]WBM79747.1 hypothetical protein KIV56_16265 [Cryobacterium breve]